MMSAMIDLPDIAGDEPAPGFSKRLARAIKESSLNQKQIGKALGLSEQAVSNWKRNQNLPGRGRGRKLASLLNVNFYWLFYDVGNMRGGPEFPSVETPSGEPAMIEILLKQVMDLNHRVAVIEEELDLASRKRKEGRSDPQKGGRTL